MDIQHLPYAPGEPEGRVGELLYRITDDLKTIARDEIELARGELEHTAQVAAADAAVVVLGGIVGLIGLGLLCLAVVVALAPLIPPLWLRLLVMAVVYLAAGGVVARRFAMRLKRDVVVDLEVPKTEARNTIKDIKDGLRG
jgi:hypothetical protein